MYLLHCVSTLIQSFKTSPSMLGRCYFQRTKKKNAKQPRHRRPNWLHTKERVFKLGQQSQSNQKHAQEEWCHVDHPSIGMSQICFFIQFWSKPLIVGPIRTIYTYIYIYIYIHVCTYMYVALSHESVTSNVGGKVAQNQHGSSHITHPEVSNT